MFQTISVGTYVHVNLHPVPAGPRHHGRDHDQRVFPHKVAYTAFVLGAVAVCAREVELQGRDEGRGEEDDQGEDGGEGCRA